MKIVAHLSGGSLLRGVLLGWSLVLMPLNVPAFGGDDTEIAGNLPWDFNVTPVLTGADRVAVTILRSPQSAGATDPEHARLEIQYHRASYTDREVADADFARLLPVTADTAGIWHIVVQSGDEIHWLNGQCMISKVQFSKIYAGLVGQVEETGRRANRAILCRCGAPCQQVDIDR